MNDQMLLDWADKVAKNGTCNRRQIGCVLVTAQGAMISSGHNGRPANIGNCLEDKFCPGREVPAEAGATQAVACYGVHAEQRAVMAASKDDMWGHIHTAFCSKAPCTQCVLLLLETPCVRIVVKTPSKETVNRELWVKAGREWISG
jgi:dCMP deaminase